MRHFVIHLKHFSFEYGNRMAHFWVQNKGVHIHREGKRLVFEKDSYPREEWKQDWSDRTY